MAIIQVTYTTKNYIPVPLGCCKEIIICVDEVWRARTVDGRNLLRATIENTGRQLSEDGDDYSGRCVDFFQFTLSIDTDQFIVNPGTGRSWGYDFTCEDVIEIIPYTCAVDSILHIIDTLPDWVIDCENVEATIDVPNKVFSVYFPVIDRVNNLPGCNFTLDFSALFDDTDTWSTLSEYNTDVPGGHRHTTPDGDITDIHLLSQTAGNVLSYDDGLYLDAGTIGTDSVDDYDTGTPGGYTHTAVDGTAKPIVVLSQDAGNIITAGSDDGNYLAISTDDNNEVSLGTDDGLFICAYDNGVLSQGEPGIVNVDISLAGTYVIFTGTAYVRTNPNTCRTRSLIICGDNYLQATLLAGGVWQYKIQDSENGGAWFDIANVTYGPFTVDMNIPLINPVFGTYSIAPGGTLSVQRRLVIITTTPSAASSLITAYALGMRSLYVGE